MRACLGGWCRSREKCADYHASDRSEPVERRCPPGQEYPEPMAHTMSLPQLIAEAQRIGENA
jgi:hypothetical protein